MLLVTVIVPIYQVAAQLSRALDSLSHQTIKEREYVLVDDGSMDESAIIAEEYALCFADFILLHAPNGGLSAARNRGLKLASGNYIGTIDSDDYIESDMFEQMSKAAEAQKAELALCGYIIHYEGQSESLTQPLLLSKTPPEHQTWPQYLLVSFADGTFGCFAPMKLYRSAFLGNSSLRYPEGISLVEDNLFFLNLVDKLANVAVVSTPFYHYVRRSESICGSYRQNGNQLYAMSYHSQCQAIKRVFAEDSAIGEQLFCKARRKFLNSLASELKRTAWRVESWSELQHILNKSRLICREEHLNDCSSMDVWERSLCSKRAGKCKILCFSTMIMGRFYHFLRFCKRLIK